MAITLKIKCQDEVHRILLQEENVTYEAVQEAIHKVHPAGTGAAKYLDDENDLCTLCPSSFSDFLTSSASINGRKILKFEITGFERSPRAPGVQPDGQTKEACPVAAILEGLLRGGANGGDKSPLADLIKMGRDHFKGFAEHGGMHGFHGHQGGRWHGGGGGHMRLAKFMVLQLHKNGLLNAKTAAALAVSSLPDLLSHTASHSDKIDWIIQANIEKLRPVLEDLRVLVARIPELEPCTSRIDDLMRGHDSPPSVAVLAVLTSVDMLSFDAQISFFEAFYVGQQARLDEMFAKSEQWTSWMPTIPLEHPGITCNGCDCPINGLRFKCKTCPDYDLCGTCFTKKTSVHGGECDAHEFELKFWPDPCMVGLASKGCRWGKGMGKWKGSGKGKAFCGKRSFREADTDCQSDQKRPCAREGCYFAATWHPTHCCGGCAKGMGKHGGRCEHKLMPEVQPEKVPDVVIGTVVGTDERTEATPDASMAVTPDRAPDFHFPVVVEDGRRLTIAWNRSDDSLAVANQFAAEHGIPAEEILAIKDFVEHAIAVSGVGGEDKTAAPQEAQKQNCDSQDLDQVIKQLEEMGLGNVEMLQDLMQSSGGDVQQVIAMLTANSP